MAQAIRTQFVPKDILSQGIGTALLIIMMMAMMILPLMPQILDILFTFNISIALVVLLATVYIRAPVEFASFPAVLLISTLLRLALNVASTRVVLLNGHLGEDAAGKVIQSFGEVVIGGSYAVGFIIFIILMIINFVVVTKGAGRISEVSARFTLDALPGKQMAIDADLNTGVISQDEAKARREAVAEESDFYGAMDGASKFIRGDAVAGIIILIINIVGGILIGTVQHNLSIAQAMKTYALLTIGDGLVAQIPSLLLSTGAAIMVTRVSKAQDMSEQVLIQLFRSSKPLYIASAILCLLGIIPGMPHVAFLSLGGLMGWIGYYISKKANMQLTEQILPETQEEGVSKATEEDPQLNKELTWEDVPQVDPIAVEIGYRLIALVDKAQNGELMNRIRGVRKKISAELGFLVPTVHISDNLDLAPNAYQIKIKGVVQGESQIFPDKLMAINPGQVFGSLDGIEVKDPAFGLKAIWIEATLKSHAQNLGYTVVDPATVIATHLSQVIHKRAQEFLGHQEAQYLLDNLSKFAPKLVEDLVPKTLSLTSVVYILRELLDEQIPIRDMHTITEKLLEFASKSTDPNYLLMGVRKGLGNLIIQQIVDKDPEIPVATLNPNLEQLLQSVAKQEQSQELVIEPKLLDTLRNNLNEFSEKQSLAGQPAVLVVSPDIRFQLAKLFKSTVESLHVISYEEIPDNKVIRVVHNIGS